MAGHFAPMTRQQSVLSERPKISIQHGGEHGWIEESMDRGRFLRLSTHAGGRANSMHSWLHWFLPDVSSTSLSTRATQSGTSTDDQLPVPS